MVMHAGEVLHEADTGKHVCHLVHLIGDPVTDGHVGGYSAGEVSLAGPLGCRGHTEAHGLLCGSVPQAHPGNSDLRW